MKKRSVRKPVDTVRSRSGVLVLALALLVGVIACASAVAAEGEPDGPSAGMPLPESQTELESLAENSQPVQLAPETNPSAAEELPISNLGRPQAEDLLESVFPSLLESPAQALDELEVEEFRSDYVAVVAPPEPSGEAPGLLSSTLPLRAENESGEKELVDLDLESVEGHLESENPLVPVEIPAELSEGISFPESNITISVATGETDRAASLLTEASAFYPNVRGNSDIAITATPTGVETYTQLRSADAPHDEVFDLAIPDGSRLKATGPGGAEVLDADGRVLLSVTVPWAIDAAGELIPASLDVAGDSLTVRVDPPADAALPILVDPVFESYNFTNVTGVGSTDWQGFSNKGFSYHWGSWPANGMTVESLPGAQTASGNQASFNYHVPRFYTDTVELPKSYIRDMKLWGLTYGMPDESGPANSRPAYPFMQVSLWSQTKQEPVALGTHFGYEGQLTDPSTVFDLKNYPNENTDAKSGGFAIATFDSMNPPYLRYVNVQQASVEVTDQDSPKIGEMSNVAPWVSSAAGPTINYQATDPGLGVHDLRLRYPAASGGTGEVITSLNCTGIASSPCPRTATNGTRTLSYNPAQIAQGEIWQQIYAVDPIGHWSEVAESRIKVDRTAPELDLAGTLTEQGTLGTEKPSYALSYNAKDGDEAGAVAASPYGTTGTGQGQLERPLGVAVDSAGNVWTADVTNNRVVEYDKNGKFVRQFGTTGAGNGQFNTPRGIAIAPNGTVWVADYGNKRLEAFTPQGAFIRQISGTEKLDGPYAVAVAKDNSVWVSDINTFKLKHFSETGAALGSSHDGESAGQINGLAIDSFGDVWATSYLQNKVYEYDSSGTLKFSFGSEGTGSGQFKGPIGIAFAPSGNFFVVDDKNNRIQEFKPDGGFMRQFGTEGSASNQLKEPRWVAVGQGNTLFVADSGNHRLARWQHADRHIESGATKVEVKVDGVLKTSNAPGCATKNCALSGEWMMNADSYSVGKHKVEVIATDGVNLATTKTIEVETHGDLTAPAVELSGTMTEQATLGTTRPTYKLKVVASDPGSTGERKSGVSSTSIKVDGAVVDSYAPGCPAGGCAITREWTMDSSSKSVGSHQIEVQATDGAGRVTSKQLTISVTRDTTPPEMTLSGALAEAPSGWVTQGTRSISATATDVAGYGVKQLRVSIDGSIVDESLVQSCEPGGCSKSKTFSIDTNQYTGGAHEAVMIAEDGAGNIRKHTWNMNVDPDGTISPSEAEDTIEAVQATSDFSVLNPPSGEQGTPTLSLQGEVIHSVGAPVETSLEGDEFELQTGDGNFTIDPQGSAGGGIANLSSESTAALQANSGGAVDTILRPIFDGAMTFQAIREASATEQFSWVVNMESDQSLRLVNDQFAQVVTDGIHPNFGITAEPAHDAVGSAVPTTLSVAGNLLTLTVHHRAGNPSAGNAPFVYPVTSGVGWEGGFTTYQVVMPPPTEQEAGELWVSWGSLSAPEAISEEDTEAIASVNLEKPTTKQHFLKVYCSHEIEYGALPRGGTPEYEKDCGNPFQNVHGGNWLYREAFHGKFFNNHNGFKENRRIWHEGTPTDGIGCVAEGDGATQENPSEPFRKANVDRCVWWGETKDGGGQKVGWGKHITPVLRATSEERAGCGNNCGQPNPWVEHDMPPFAYYLWASEHYEFHETDCIDCG